MPVCRPMGDGLYEVRTSLDDKRIARVLFCFSGGKMVLLHGFIKKSQKTPKPDLELAQLFANNYQTPRKRRLKYLSKYFILQIQYVEKFTHRVVPYEYFSGLIYRSEVS
jgi:hypothetical protein